MTTSGTYLTLLATSSRVLSSASSISQQSKRLWRISSSIGYLAIRKRIEHYAKHDDRRRQIERDGRIMPAHLSLSVIGIFLPGPVHDQNLLNLAYAVPQSFWNWIAITNFSGNRHRPSSGHALRFGQDCGYRDRTARRDG
jgi:hypothetical protein